MRLRRSMFAAMSALLLGSAIPTASVLAQGASAPVEVTGVEYAFQGLPSNVPVGTTFRLVNGGQEDHEFIVVRANEGTTETLEELLAMPPEQTAGKLTDVGIVFAHTGKTSIGTLTLDQPGRYFAACFITQGTKDGVAPSPGPGGQNGTPHALLGMVGEFTVGPPVSPAATS
jgi:plastocyanin